MVVPRRYVLIGLATLFVVGCSDGKGVSTSDWDGVPVRLTATATTAAAARVDTANASPLVRKLVRQLSSPDQDLRGRSVCELSALGTEGLPAVEYLLGKLSDTDPVNPYTCRAIDASINMHWRGIDRGWRTIGGLTAVALVSIAENSRDGSIGETLHDYLQHSESEARANAALALGLLEQKTSANAVRQRLTRDPNAKVREYAAQALADMGDSESEAQLIRSLSDDAAKVRAASAGALGTLDRQAGGAAIVTALENESSVRAREKMAWSLGVIDYKAGVNTLINLVRNDESIVREQAAWALGLLGKPEAIDALAENLSYSKPEVREKSAWALGIIGHRNAVPALVESLSNDEAANVRHESAWALGMIGDSSAESALVKATEDEDDSVRQQAMWALSEL